MLIALLDYKYLKTNTLNKIKIFDDCTSTCSL